MNWYSLALLLYDLAILEDVREVRVGVVLRLNRMWLGLVLCGRKDTPIPLQVSLSYWNGANHDNFLQTGHPPGFPIEADR